MCCTVVVDYQSEANTITFGHRTFFALSFRFECVSIHNLDMCVGFEFENRVLGRMSVLSSESRVYRIL